MFKVDLHNNSIVLDVNTKLKMFPNVPPKYFTPFITKPDMQSVKLSKLSPVKLENYNCHQRNKQQLLVEVL